MTTREKLHEEIDRAPEESLESILHYVETVTRPARNGRKGEHILEFLTRHQFDGPADLSENLDLYARGEKRIDSELRNLSGTDKPECSE